MSRFSDRGVAGELMAVSAETEVEDEGSAGIELDEDEMVDEADENVSALAGVPFGRPRGAAEAGSTAAAGDGACARGDEGGSAASEVGGMASTSEALAKEATGASMGSSTEAATPLTAAADSAGDTVGSELAAVGSSGGVDAGSEGAGASGEAGGGEATSRPAGSTPFSPALGDWPISIISIAAEASTEPFFFFLLAFLDEADFGPDGSGLVGSNAAAGAAPLAFIFCRMRLSVGRASTWYCDALGSLRSIKATRSAKRYQIVSYSAVAAITGGAAQTLLGLEEPSIGGEVQGRGVSS
jgi:hypothetical protein